MAELELDLLRTLVAIREAGGFSRAAIRLGRTQSAVSLQVRRLEEAAGARLFDRQGRASVLTAQGEVLVHYARRLLTLEREAVAALGAEGPAEPARIGCAQDFAEKWLPAILGRYAREHQGAQVDARVERNADLARDVEAGELDAALTLDTGRSGGGEVLGALPAVWIAARRFRPPPGEPLPLALLSPPCLFRDRALRALDRAGLPWRIVFQSVSLGGLWAAARAGLGLTVRTPVGIPAGLGVAKLARPLPALGHVNVVLHRRAGAVPAATEAFVGLLRGEVVRQIPGAAGRSARRRH